MEFSMQEYWNELPSPSSGDLSDPGIEHGSLALAGIFSTTDPPGKPTHTHSHIHIYNGSPAVHLKQKEHSICTSI